MQSSRGVDAVEERGRLEMAGNRWEPEVEGRGREKKIGWEMRDCMEAKSQPAGPACCLRDCKLSLRMQTDKQDRHHLPILPSTSEIVVHVAPSPSSHCIFFFYLSLHFQEMSVHMHVYELAIYFLYLLHYFLSVSFSRWWNESACSILSPLFVRWFVASP